MDEAHPVPLDVVEEHALALDEAPVLLARDAGADEPGLRLLLFEHDGGRGSDGLGHRAASAADAIASTMLT